jgi:hypothetical protein
MKRTHLLSTAAVAIVLSAGMALAQAPAPAKDQAQAPAPAPPALQNAPAEKIAPAAPVRPAPAAQTPNAADPAKAQTSPNAAPPTGAADAKTDMKVPPAAAGKTDIKNTGETNKAVAPASGTTGQGAASAARLSGEQRSKITSVIRQQKVQPVTLDVSIAVGTRVPQNVRYYPLPGEVVTIYPEWRGYDYILVGSQILVLDPRTNEIVAILDA